MAIQPLILASSSVRRQEILQRAGIPFIVEASSHSESPLESVDKPTLQEKLLEITRRKALDVLKHRKDHPILAADTIVTQNGLIYGKPTDYQSALSMIASLAGSVHEVMTGVWLMIPPNPVEDDSPSGGTNSPTRGKDSLVIEEGMVETTKVWVHPMAQEEIEAYVQAEKPYDAAGAYKIQEQFSKFIRSIEGSYHNVVGLPIDQVYRLLKKYTLIE